MYVQWPADACMYPQRPTHCHCNHAVTAIDTFSTAENSSAGEVALDGPIRERWLLRCSGVMGCLGTFREFLFNAHNCCVLYKLIPAFWGLYYGLSNAGSCFILYQIFILPLVSWDCRHCSGLYLCLFKHVICSCGDEFRASKRLQSHLTTPNASLDCGLHT